VLVNEGRKAGASLPHSHSQLAWLREPPPAVVEELPNLERDSCALCKLLEVDTLEIALLDDLSLRAAPAGRAPYELLVAPRAHDAHPGEDALAGALRLLQRAILGIREIEGAISLNIWLHEGGHWHFELVPRLSVFAGLELGAGIYVNWLLPEEAARRLRAG
jgi:UDPglucose--hexose-1-phosphate uridylyltransferase